MLPRVLWEKKRFSPEDFLYPRPQWYLHTCLSLLILCSRLSKHLKENLLLCCVFSTLTLKVPERYPTPSQLSKGVVDDLLLCVSERPTLTPPRGNHFPFWSSSYIPRAGELSTDEINKVVSIISEPTEYKIPDWFLNRRRDFTTGKTKQVVSNQLSSAIRDDLVRLKKIRFVFFFYISDFS